MSDITDVVGIDPSLTALAVAHMTRTDEGVQVFSSKPASSLYGRLERMIELSSKAIADIPRREESTVICLEGYGAGTRGNASLQLGEFGGLFRYFLARRMNDPMPMGAICPKNIYEVPPACLKKFLTGKGNADKMAVALAVAKRYGVEFRTSDEFDAYGLSQMAACIAGWREPATDFQREAIDVVLHGKAKPKKRKSA